jgi:hypothetical protein
MASLLASANVENAPEGFYTSSLLIFNYVDCPLLGEWLGGS